MAIAQDEIKILKSERLSDTDDGGGRITGDEVVDGVPNDVFPDIGDIDRATGRVRLRKLYGAVQSQNTDLFVNGNFIVSRPPSDDNLSATIFTTRDWADERVQAQNNLESYLAPGPIQQLIPLGTQLAGQKAITVYGLTTTPLPAVNDSILISEEDLNTGNVTAQQYLRITEIEFTDIEYQDNSGSFTRRVITMELSTPLGRDYPGNPLVERQFSLRNTPTFIRETRVADLAKYYSIAPVVDVPAPGGFSVTSGSLFAQLVPSTTQETPIIDALLGSRVTAYPASDDTEQYTPTVARSPAPGGGWQATAVTHRGILPGSLQIGAEGSLWSDDATREVNALSNPAGLTIDVDHEDGRITVSGMSEGGTTAFDITYVPAVFVNETTDTYGFPVDENTRRFNYTVTLPEIPAPGSVFVEYRAFGNTIRLEEQGDGILRGPEGSGSGSVNFVTGTVLVTLGAQPDIGSLVVFGMGTAALMQTLDGVVDVEPPRHRLKLVDEDTIIAANTVTVTWEIGGTVYTATDNGAGRLTGDATGFVFYRQGIIDVIPNDILPTGTEFALSYQVWDPALVQFGQPLPPPPANAAEVDPGEAPDPPEISNRVKANDELKFTINGAPLAPGSVSFTTRDWIDGIGIVEIFWEDNADGSLASEVRTLPVGFPRVYNPAEVKTGIFDGKQIYPVESITPTRYEPRNGGVVGGGTFDPNTEVGTIDYTTGEVTIPLLGEEQNWILERYDMTADEFIEAFGQSPVPNA
ncbi:MAG: hypothetical protein ABF296_09415 [Oceanococcaceae bacterium]